MAAHTALLDSEAQDAWPCRAVPQPPQPWPEKKQVPDLVLAGVRAALKVAACRVQITAANLTSCEKRLGNAITAPLSAWLSGCFGRQYHADAMMGTAGISDGSSSQWWHPASRTPRTCDPGWSGRSCRRSATWPRRSAPTRRSRSPGGPPAPAAAPSAACPRTAPATSARSTTARKTAVLSPPTGDIRRVSAGPSASRDMRRTGTSQG